jgi:hypothetical protein
LWGVGAVDEHRIGPGASLADANSDVKQGEPERTTADKLVRRDVCNSALIYVGVRWRTHAPRPSDSRFK